LVALSRAGSVAASFPAGDHGSTFGGNPLACAAANVVLDAVANDHFLAGVRGVGAHFKQALTDLQSKYPAHIAEVRGAGLILGMEMQRNEDAAAIARRMLEQGVIINCTAGNVLRFIPPLIFTKNEVDELIRVLDHCILDICDRGGL